MILTLKMKWTIDFRYLLIRMACKYVLTLFGTYQPLLLMMPPYAPPQILIPWPCWCPRRQWRRWHRWWGWFQYCPFQDLIILTWNPLTAQGIMIPITLMLSLLQTSSPTLPDISIRSPLHGLPRWSRSSTRLKSELVLTSLPTLPLSMHAWLLLRQLNPSQGNTKFCVVKIILQGSIKQHTWAFTLHIYYFK